MPKPMMSTRGRDKTWLPNSAAVFDSFCATLSRPSRVISRVRARIRVRVRVGVGVTGDTFERLRATKV